MNNQQAFEKIWLHFVVNNGRFSIVGNSEEEVMPRYYGTEGARCPVGLLIDSRDYNEDIEGTAVSKIYEEIPSLQEVDVLLLSAIQLAHDNSATDWAVGFQSRKEARKEFKKGLQRIAKKFELEIPRKARNNG